MSDSTYNLLIVAIVCIAFVLLVAIVLWTKYMFRDTDRRNTVDDFPDGTSPVAWKVRNPLNKNELSDAEFKRLYGMSRNRYVRKEYGGWSNVDPLDRLLAGNITDEEYDNIIASNDYSYKDGNHTLIPRRKKNKYGPSGDNDDIYRGLS